MFKNDWLGLTKTYLSIDALPYIKRHVDMRKSRRHYGRKVKMDNGNEHKISVYELGIIKNALRGRVLDVESFRTEGVLKKDEKDMNDKVNAFQAELIHIEQKLENISPEKGIDI